MRLCDFELEFEFEIEVEFEEFEFEIKMICGKHPQCFCKLFRQNLCTQRFLSFSVSFGETKQLVHMCPAQ